MDYFAPVDPRSTLLSGAMHEVEEAVGWGWEIETLDHHTFPGTSLFIHLALPLFLYHPSFSVCWSILTRREACSLGFYSLTRQRCYWSFYAILTKSEQTFFFQVSIVWLNYTNEFYVSATEHEALRQLEDSGTKNMNTWGTFRSAQNTGTNGHATFQAGGRTRIFT